MPIGWVRSGVHSDRESTMSSPSQPNDDTRCAISVIRRVFGLVRRAGVRSVVMRPWCGHRARSRVAFGKGFSVLPPKYRSADRPAGPYQAGFVREHNEPDPVAHTEFEHNARNVGLRGEWADGQSRSNVVIGQS